MNSFYIMLYGKFADLQVDQSFSARFVYPSSGSMPSLKGGREISDCVVRIPPIRVNGSISYGPFVFEDGELGQSAAVGLAVASTLLMSGKSVFRWLYRDYIEEWIAPKDDPIKASYVINIILDTLARQRIQQIEGEHSNANVMQVADRLAYALLPKRLKDFGALSEAALASNLLHRQISAPAAIAKMTQNFADGLGALDLNFSRIIDALYDKMSNTAVKITRAESGWDRVAKVADNLYAIVTGMPGKWHSVYLPYSNTLIKGNLDSIFESRMLSEKELYTMQVASQDDILLKEVFFEMMREEKHNEKVLARMTKAAYNLGFGSAGFPASDYVSYYNLSSELAPQIRRIVERVRLVKNALDENMMEESGNIDLQIAIQAIASETARNDIFTKDENLLKKESWTILIDSSLSLSGSSKEVKAVSICLAETAREVMGQNPWGMFAFSDDLYCIKDYVEPYGGKVKARIGGMTQGGLSLIPDAIRACRKMIAEHASDKNFLILVSDGLPSGYPGIEEEFATSVKELARYGIDLAAISVAGSSIKKTIPKAKIVEQPTDLIKGFLDIYYTLSS